MEIDEQIKSKLETIKESIIGHKFIVDSLLDRSDKLETELRNYQAQLQELRNNTVRTDERIATIQRYLDGMSTDIRAVRNTVVGAMIVATVVGVSGLALSALSRHSPTTSTDRSSVARRLSIPPSPLPPRDWIAESGFKV